ncbi:MAG: RNA chaperone Hfq [Lautropia sp.]|nr:RNA chaperone Hfq [Lautropia sp.]
MSVKEPAEWVQEPATQAEPVAAAEGEGQAETAASKSKSLLNQQFTTLNSLRRARTWVDVYLITGTCLHGQIRSFDANMLLLQTRTGDVALYHHAISSVIRAQKRSASSKASVKSAGFNKTPRKGAGLMSGGMGERNGGFTASRPPRTVTIDRPLREVRTVRDEKGGDDASGNRLGRGRLSAVPRRPPEAPPGVVVVRHKRVRTIVKPDDA